MALPVESPVASRMAPTVACLPQSNASATARTEGVQRNGFGGASTGRPTCVTPLRRPGGDQLPHLPQPALAEPCNPKALSGDLKIDGMAVAAAATNLDRRRQHGRDRSLGTMGDIAHGHVFADSAFS